MSAGAPIPPNPPYPNVPPPPITTGNTVLKIILIVVGALVLLGVIVAGVVGVEVYKLAKSVDEVRNRNVRITTPGGTITTGRSASAADLGIDLYPGATTSEGSMNMKTPNGSMVTAVYLSPDPADKIVAFYKEKLGDQASIVRTGNGAVLSVGEKNRTNIVITITPESNSSKIAIVHITNNKTE
jgi:hypothetical protein